MRTFEIIPETLAMFCLSAQYLGT